MKPLFDELFDPVGVAVWDDDEDVWRTRPSFVASIGTGRGMRFCAEPIDCENCTTFVGLKPLLFGSGGEH
jgi:hypothetical protein